MAFSQRFIAALVALQPRPRAEIARAIGMEPSNLSAALTGQRKFPVERLPKLYELLNLNEDGLTSHVVHLWRVGNSVSDLDVVADVAFPDGANFGGVWRDGAGPFDLARTLDLPLIAVTDGKTRAIVRSEIGMFASPDPINPSTVGALRHRLGHPTGLGQTRMLSIAGEQFKRWQVGDVTVEEFDAVVSPLKRARSPAR